MGTKLTEQEMEVYLKFSGWWKLDDESWFPLPIWFPPNPSVSESGGFWTVLDAFNCQMQKDGHGKSV